MIIPQKINNQHFYLLKERKGTTLRLINKVDINGDFESERFFKIKHDSIFILDLENCDNLELLEILDGQEHDNDILLNCYLTSIGKVNINGYEVKLIYPKWQFINLFLENYKEEI